MPASTESRIEPLVSPASPDASGSRVVDDVRSPLLHAPRSCPALPAQHSIVPAAADVVVPSGATVIRNDTVKIDATSKRATPRRNIFIQDCFRSDFTIRVPWENVPMSGVTHGLNFALKRHPSSGVLGRRFFSNFILHFGQVPGFFDVTFSCIGHT